VTAGVGSSTWGCVSERRKRSEGEGGQHRSRIDEEISKETSTISLTSSGNSSSLISTGAAGVKWATSSSSSVFYINVRSGMEEADQLSREGSREAKERTNLLVGVVGLLLSFNRVLDDIRERLAIGRVCSPS